MALLSESENPNGLHQRYRITKADGTPCDPDAMYFVLRLDSGGSDAAHIRACRSAAKVYAGLVYIDTDHLQQVGLDLFKLIERLELIQRAETTIDYSKQRISESPSQASEDCP